MTSKVCFKCSCEKPLEEFYAHPKMADGRLGKCKACTKADTIANRHARVDQYREYDRARASLPKRVQARTAYAATEAGRERGNAAKRAYIERHPDRTAANRAVSKAIKSGRLTRDPCHCCGAAEVEGHHADYSKPLDVTWLCIEHHNQLHNEHAAHLREIAKKEQQ